MRYPFSSPRIACFLLWSVLASPFSARADAVPAPPERCPKGQLPITSHSGPECVAPPPTNCPPGWRPAIRGVCYLDTCDSDAACGSGKQCRQVDLCLQEFIEEWQYTSQDPPRNRPLFAGPPMRLDPPRHVIRAVGVCGNGRNCSDPAKCGKGKLCLPQGVDRPGVWSGLSSQKNP